MTIAAEIPIVHDIIADAERLRRQAKAIALQYPNRYGDLLGQPSGWSVVTKNGWWPKTYLNMEDEERLWQLIERGHKVVLIVGLVAKPGTPLNESYGRRFEHRARQAFV